MPSLDYPAQHLDDDTTPAKSFFFHSPANSPVDLPNPNNPFVQITGTFTALANKTDRRNSKIKSSSIVRPTSSDGQSKSGGFLSRFMKQTGDQTWQLGALTLF